MTALSDKQRDAVLESLVVGIRRLDADDLRLMTDKLSLEEIKRLRLLFYRAAREREKEEEER